MTAIHFRASRVIELQDRYTSNWHDDPDSLTSGSAVEKLIIEQHRQNFELWHEEDKAREPGALDTEIAQVKRNIDVLNQRRNDMITEIDLHLADNEFAHHRNEGSPWNSETVSSIVDRLSIASLKVYHMLEQVERKGTAQEHRQDCKQKLLQLRTQQSDLAQALQAFIDDIIAGNRQNKLYRQFKMYNDAALNPRIYGTLK